MSMFFTQGTRPELYRRGSFAYSLLTEKVASSFSVKQDSLLSWQVAALLPCTRMYTG